MAFSNRAIVLTDARNALDDRPRLRLARAVLQALHQQRDRLHRLAQVMARGREELRLRAATASSRRFLLLQQALEPGARARSPRAVASTINAVRGAGDDGKRAHEHHPHRRSGEKHLPPSTIAVASGGAIAAMTQA
jgi:hypothetical protein